MEEKPCLPPEWYFDVHVLLLCWENADRAFHDQCDELSDVFENVYKYSPGKWRIPNHDPLYQLMGRIRQFLEVDRDDVLLILHYGGHGSTNTDKSAVWSW